MDVHCWGTHILIGCIYDTIRPPQEVEVLALCIPGTWHIETVSDHFMSYQTPEWFLEMVLPFLQGS
jgi:hypothetical protein